MTHYTNVTIFEQAKAFRTQQCQLETWNDTVA